MRRARVTVDEVRAAIRAAGCGDPRSVAAVVLETDGSFSVIRGADGAPAADTLEADAEGLHGSRARGREGLD